MRKKQKKELIELILLKNKQLLNQDNEIQRLNNLNKFIKEKLDESIKGNITIDPIVNSIIKKTFKKDIKREWLILARLWKLIPNPIKNG